MSDLTGNALEIRPPDAAHRVNALVGNSTSFAKRLLKAANCAIGRVASKRARKRAQVGKGPSQRTRTGTTLDAGAKIGVTVGRR